MNNDLKLVKRMQCAVLLCKPTMYVTDSVRHQLVIDQDLTRELVIAILIDFGKELLEVKSIKTIAAESGDSRCKEELQSFNRCYEDFCRLYTTLPKPEEIKPWDTFSYGSVTVSFPKMKVVKLNEK